MTIRHRETGGFLELLANLHKLIAPVIKRVHGKDYLLEYERRYREACTEIEYVGETSDRDHLTSLRNKSYFETKLQEAFEEGKGKEQIAVLFMDLDGFKKVNDQKGHQRGDNAMLIASIRIRRAARHGDVVARWGGDEFAVITHVPGKKEATELASRIVRAFKSPIHISLDRGSTQVKVGISIGIALGPKKGENIAEFLDRADKAMYRAKNSKGETSWCLAT